MASFWDMLSANGAPFGTLTPQEQAVTPNQTPQTLWHMLSAAYGGLVNTAKEAGQASETMRQGGDYNAAPAVNAAMLTMGATPFGMPGAGALGSGPLSFTERMALGKQVAMDVANKGRSIGDYGLGTARRTAPDAPKGTFDDLAARTRQAFKDDTANIIDQYRSATGQQPQGRADMLLAPGETLGEGDGFTLGAGANDKSAGAAILANQGIRAYHRSPNDFSKFDLSYAGSTTDPGKLGAAHYFSTDPNVASLGPHRYEADIALKNPIELQYPAWGADKQALITERLGLPLDAHAQYIRAAAMKRGYDGAILDYSPVGYNHKEIAAYHDSIINIIKKYGLAGLVPAAGALAPPQQQAPIF